jgi:phosphoribosylaminoimidazole-succinocarboxamide synthase
MSEGLLTIRLDGIPVFKSGKVREVFDCGDRLLMVATDRISAFDCILPSPIPDKGRVLTMLSAWWFDRLAHIVPHHLISVRPADFPEAARLRADDLQGRAMLVRKTEALPIECVVRGYLVGSGWKEYAAQGSVSGLELREGYRLADRIDEPIFTPAHKADAGHDENISLQQVRDRLGKDLAEKLKELSVRLYLEAADHARTRGIIIADTKFEFGLVDGELVLIDEILTPDSSRFWPADSYRPGESPLSFDKQYVRDYLEGLDWDKTPPAPALPDDIVDNTRRKYLDAYRRLTGRDLMEVLSGHAGAD